MLRKNVTHLGLNSKTIVYQKITISINTNATTPGIATLFIDNKNYPIVFNDNGINGYTRYTLFESLKRQLDISYIVTRDATSIYIQNVFATPATSVSFNGNDVGIDSAISKNNVIRNISVPYLNDTSTNQTIIIDEEFDFGGCDFVIPKDSTLVFEEGGCISNARITYNNTLLKNCRNNIVNCICTGKLVNKEVTPEMFGAISSHFTSKLYDISHAIQDAFDNDNFGIVIENDSDARYEWRNTVKLYRQDSNEPLNVSIAGRYRNPIAGKGSWFYINIITIEIKTKNAFKCYKGQFGFSTVKWPSIYLNNLSFRFDDNLKESTFFEGILAYSNIDSIHVYNCYRFINGGLKYISLVTNSIFEICEYAFGGYMVDAKIENSYFTAKRKDVEIEPVFYMNSILCGDGKIDGSHVGTIYSNNYIDYFYTIFVMGHAPDDCIITHGNTFDIFKYFAQCKRRNDSLVLTDKSSEEGCPICSNSDLFRRCNNRNRNDRESTDKHLLSRVHKSISDSVNIRKTINGEIEIYSIFGKIMNDSSFQVNSVFDQTNDYIFAKAKASDTNLESVMFTSSPSFCFKERKGKHKGEFICGGMASMYAFKHLSSSTIQINTTGAKYRRPVLYDLQDMSVKEFPTTQLFDGRRIILNNKIYTFKQQDSRDSQGSWKTS